MIHNDSNLDTLSIHDENLFTHLKQKTQYGTSSLGENRLGENNLSTASARGGKITTLTWHSAGDDKPLPVVHHNENKRA